MAAVRYSQVQDRRCIHEIIKGGTTLDGNAPELNNNSIPSVSPFSC